MATNHRSIRNILAGAVWLFAMTVAGEAIAAPPHAGIWAELAKTSDLRAEFRQTQTRKILKKPLESRGHLEFQRPEHLVWSVVSPTKSTFELKGSVATMEFPDLGLKDSFDLQAMPEAQRLASSLLVWLNADPATVEKDFSITYLDSPPRIHLEPKEATLKGLIQHMELEVVPGPWRVSSVRMTEPSGDTVHLHFQSVVLDGKSVPDAP